MHRTSDSEGINYFSRGCVYIIAFKRKEIYSANLFCLYHDKNLKFSPDASCIASPTWKIILF